MVDWKSWQPQPKIYNTPPFTLEVPGTKKIDSETRPRRNARYVDALKARPEPDVATIWDIVKRSSEKFGNAKAIGHRKLIQTHEEVKKIKKMVDGKEEMVDKKWTYSELSEYHYQSFIEYERAAVRAGAGLRKLGMNAGDRLHMFAGTRYARVARM